MEIRGLRYPNGEIQRLLRDGGRMAFVVGPRQVGKITVSRRLLADSGTERLYFTIDVRSAASERPPIGRVRV